MKDTIWRYLEQYDLPVVVGTNAGMSGHAMDTQVVYLAFVLVVMFVLTRVVK